MKRYTPIEQVTAAVITRMQTVTDKHGSSWEITLDDGSQVYESLASFQHARVGDYYVRPVPNQFNPLPKGYYLSGISFPFMFREALPELEAARVPQERIDAMLASLDVQCQRFPGTTTTIALAALPSGYVVAQGMSSCIDPKAFDAQKSVQYATQDAMDKARIKLRELESYALIRMREQAGQPVQSLRAA